MEGLVLVSHGKLAEGMLDTINQFFEVRNQITCLTLDLNENSDSFTDKLNKAIKSVDTGDGVIIAADLFGGTPSNKALAFVGGKVRLMAGINLGIILEIISSREAGRIDLDKVAEMGRKAIVQVENLGVEQEDEDF